MVKKCGLLFLLALAIGLFCEKPALADVAVNGRAILFYTDDVGIFSATRRLSRDDDPTQPALDTALTKQRLGCRLRAGHDPWEIRCPSAWNHRAQHSGTGVCLYRSHNLQPRDHPSASRSRVIGGDASQNALLLCSPFVFGRERRSETR